MASGHPAFVTRCLALLDADWKSQQSPEYETVYDVTHSANDALKIVRRPYEHRKGVYEYLSSGKYPFSIDVTCAVMTDLAYHETWDDACACLRVLDGDLNQPDGDVVTWTVCWPWPFSDREYVYRRRIRVHKRADGRKVFALHSKACTHDSMPVAATKRGRVRVELYEAFVAFEELANGGCKFCFTGVDDPKAETLPNWLINFAVSKGLPNYFSKQSKAIEGYEDWKNEKKKKKGN